VVFDADGSGGGSYTNDAAADFHRRNAAKAKAAVPPMKAAVPPMKAAVPPMKAAVPPIKAAVPPMKAAVSPMKAAAAAPRLSRQQALDALSKTATGDGGVEFWRTLVATSTAELKGINTTLQAACDRATGHGRHSEDAIRLITVPFKSASSAARKRFRDYGGDVAKLVDFTRFSIICTTPEALADLLEHLHQHADLAFAVKVSAGCASRQPRWLPVRWWALRA
jgi:hypothetical protein